MTEDINIRPIVLDDTDLIVEWRNADAVRSNLFSQSEITRESHIRFFNEMVITGKYHQFIIELDHDATKVPIGTIFLKNIDRTNEKCELGIFIGSQIERGRGYGTKAISRVLEYAFMQLSVNKVYLTVFNDNHPAIRSYEKAGFTLDGILRDDVLINGRFRDVTIMSILRKEWEKLAV